MENLVYRPSFNGYDFRNIPHGEYILLKITIFVVLWLVVASSAFSADFFVSTNGANSPPYTNWTMAARVIQDAIDLTRAGDTVWVNDGIYETGGQVVNGLPNRLAITNPITVRSVNGPSNTIVRGAGPRGNSAVRCVYLHFDATLSGFTLTNGHTTVTNLWSGYAAGGIYAGVRSVISNCIVTGCQADYAGGVYNGIMIDCTIAGNLASNMGGGVYNGVLTNCVIEGNRAESWGGGAYNVSLSQCQVLNNQGYSGGGLHSGSAQNCVFDGNTATYQGGGANNARLLNCTLVSNTADYGGGAYQGSATNSILYYNSAGLGGADYEGALLSYCCTRIPPGSGAGNITNAPDLIGLGDGNYRLMPASPCIDVGTNNHLSVDLDGAQRIQAAKSPALIVDMGAYEYSPNHPIHYVALGGANIFPYDNWSRAANRIETAVEIAVPGDKVIVSNGTYNAGGGVIQGQMTNRVAITKAVLVESFSGPDATTIVGAGPLGDAAVRCVYLTNGAQLVGFTITGGCTRTSGVWNQEQVGGGIFCDGDAVISNCVVMNSAAYNSGGGVYGGRLYRCTLTNNLAVMRGGGAYASRLQDCTLVNNAAEDGGGGNACQVYGGLISGNAATNGGGLYECETHDAQITHNSAVMTGGGIYNNSQRSSSNCLIAHNSAGMNAGGAYRIDATDCVVSNNLAGYNTGGLLYGTFRNCVITHNTSTNLVGGIGMATALWCRITFNAAVESGGGAYNSMVVDSLLQGNSARYGGGAQNCILSNCLVAQNAGENGGGLNQGFAYRCVFSNNTATEGGGTYMASTWDSSYVSNVAYFGGGAFGGRIDRGWFVGNCTTGVGANTGGGALGSVMSNCVLMHNRASVGGGMSGAMWGWGSGGSLWNCLIAENHAGHNGGVIGTWLYNCTVVSNTAAMSGGGVNDSVAVNIISYYNVCSNQPEFNNHNNLYYSDESWSNACTWPAPAAGSHFITNAPLFEPAQPYRLSTHSPCVDTGHEQNWMAQGRDLDDNPRILSTNVDLGCYEYVPTPYEDWKLAYWHQLHPPEGDQSADPDVDRIGNLMEYALALNPTLYNTEPTYSIGMTNLPQGTYGEIRYAQRAGLTNAILLVEANSNLLAPLWQSGTNVTETIDIHPTGALERVTTRLKKSADEEPVLFLRLKALSSY
ncbi:MAG TPA: hypothetical protein DCZ95_14780 [Verrucomicrobia bacterium]|nr:MAG: hypothetical protein A2X46_18115 [Lentisphaerae bacterium GWF2_57_35]HBA85349.1 hypothetical protein [Verrucomicrobiota bacterium]